MSAKQTYSDADLTAYLDGELEAEESAKIEAALANDAGLVSRAEGLRIDVDALRSAGTALLDAAPTAPTVLLQEGERPPKQQPRDATSPQLRPPSCSL